MKQLIHLVKKLLIQLEFLKRYIPEGKRTIIGGGFVLLLLVILFLSFQSSPENAAQPKQPFNISAFGTLPDLKEAINNDSDMKFLTDRLLSYDEAFIFVNYNQINNDMALLLFYWSGLDKKTLNELGSQKAIAVFLRRAYALPNEEPIIGNPLLEDNPWGDLFNMFKAQILMQGQGYKIYDGLAYYDNEEDRMIIEGNLSKNFVNGFSEFLNTQDVVSRKKHLNNFLLFISHTKGLENLNDEEKEMIKMLQGGSK